MHALTITRYGPPEVLELREAPTPEPGPGEVLIRVRAAGLNFAEVAARQGLYPDAPPPPCVVGYEVAGTVEALGEETSGFETGERVLALVRFGGHATHAIARAEAVLKLPEGLDFVQAAAIPVNYLTAHHMLFQIGTVHPGSSVLVHMAAGGVGTAVLQLLQTVDDITSFGTASPGKHGYLRELGCTHPIDYRSQDYENEIRQLTDGRGVDIVLDPLGGRDWRRGWRLLAPTGRLVAFGFANAISGSRRNLLHVATQFVQIPRMSPMGAMDANRSLQGVNMGHLWDESRLLTRQLVRILSLWREGVVRPTIFAEVPLAEGARAHGLLESRQNQGKVVFVA